MFQIIKKGSLEYAELLSEGFPQWALKVTFPFLIDDALDNATDGLSANDDSIDAFFVNEETKDIYFVQCKSAKSEKDLKVCPKEWLSYLYDVPNKLEAENYIRKHKNERIKDIASDYAIYNKKGYTTNFIFFHIGYLSNTSILDSYSNFKYYGFAELKEQYHEYESSISLTEPEFCELNITYAKDPMIIEEEIGNHHNLVSILTGDEIVRLRETYKHQLFDKNVRYNLGLNKVNKEIVKSARDEKANFYFFNNGLTITASKFKNNHNHNHNHNKIRVKRPQIINGAQTVASIYTAYLDRLGELKRRKKDEEEAKQEALKEFSKLKVLFRIINTGRKEEDKFEQSVIRCNNTQNAVKARDFYANNPEQRELQEQFSKLGYFYEIKRGEREFIKNNKHTRLKKKLSDFEYNKENIDIEKLASLSIAYDGEPDAKSVGAERILNDDDAYQKIFGSKVAEITLEQVKKMILAYNIFSLLEEEVKNLKKLLKLLLHIDDDRDNISSSFLKVKKIVDESIIFNEVLKSKYSDEYKYRQERETHKQLIRKYSCFTQGKYFALAIFSLILEKCNYEEQLLRIELYRDKEFIKEQIVKPWLHVILSKLLVKEYKRAVDKDGISLNTFYLRTSSFKNIKTDFTELDEEENEHLDKMFPLNLASKN